MQQRLEFMFKKNKHISNNRNIKQKWWKPFSNEFIHKWITKKEQIKKDKNVIEALKDLTLWDDIKITKVDKLGTSRIIHVKNYTIEDCKISLYVIVMSCTGFRVNPHSIVCLNVDFLLEAGIISEV